MSDKDAPLWERMRAAAAVMEEARNHLPDAFSRDYCWDETTLRSFANQWQEEHEVRAALVLVLIRENCPFPQPAAGHLLDKFDITVKKVH